LSVAAAADGQDFCHVIFRSCDSSDCGIMVYDAVYSVYSYKS